MIVRFAGARTDVDQKIARGPEGLAQHIAREVPLWRDVIEKAGIPRE
jgi:hypothetical protein